MVGLRRNPPVERRFESLPEAFSEIPNISIQANTVLRRYLDYLRHERRNAPPQEVIEIKDDLEEFLEADYQNQLN